MQISVHGGNDVPDGAKEYYCDGDLYIFDKFQTDTCGPLLPQLVKRNNCFAVIRDDEAEHVIMIKYLQHDVALTSMNNEGCNVPPGLMTG